MLFWQRVEHSHYIKQQKINKWSWNTKQEIRVLQSKDLLRLRTSRIVELWDWGRIDLVKHVLKIKRQNNAFYHILVCGDGRKGYILKVGEWNKSLDLFRRTGCKEGRTNEKWPGQWHGIKEQFNFEMSCQNPFGFYFALWSRLVEQLIQALVNRVVTSFTLHSQSKYPLSHTPEHSGTNWPGNSSQLLTCWSSSTLPTGSLNRERGHKY